MILIQLSAAQGPAECCLAVTKALKVLIKEAEALKLKVKLLEEELGPKANSFKSVLLSVEGKGVLAFAKGWNGTILWSCKSPYRPKHKRKNWFITGSYSQYEENELKNDIKFEACRSSGPGGQHANKTSSAVRAIHLASGIDVKVQSERSQHANKRLAIALIERKLVEKENLAKEALNSSRHKSHHLIERGNAIRVFRGERFTDKQKDNHYA
jgi:peptide chain release factor